MTEIVDATDSLHVNQNPVVIQPASPPQNQDPIAPSTTPTRTNQQRMLPTAVQTRTLSQIISGSNTASIYVPTNAGAVHLVNFTLNNDLNHQVLAVPDMSLYIGITDISQVADADEWPRIGFEMHSFPVSFMASDWGQTNGIDQVAKVTWYNNSGDYQDVLVVAQWRVIVQPETLGSSR